LFCGIGKSATFYSSLPFSIILFLFFSFLFGDLRLVPSFRAGEGQREKIVVFPFPLFLFFFFSPFFFLFPRFVTCPGRDRQKVNLRGFFFFLFRSSPFLLFSVFLPFWYFRGDDVAANGVARSQVVPLFSFLPYALGREEALHNLRFEGEFFPFFFPSDLFLFSPFL